MTAAEWVLLDDAERSQIALSWDAYEREGIAFIFLSAALLAADSDIAILDIEIGTYHAGEYVIHYFIDPDELRVHRENLPKSHHGIRLFWMEAGA